MATYSGPCTKCGRPIWSTERENGYAVYLPRWIDPSGRFPFHPSCAVGEAARILAKWRSGAADGDEDAIFCLRQARLINPDLDGTP